MTLGPVVENALYFLALLNPASKVMFLSAYSPTLDRRQIRELAWKSSVAAFLILSLLAWGGEFILTKVFRVELYSLQITGGLIVFLIGWTAVREGRFMQKQEQAMRADFTDLSLVPLAAPLIAGPGTIAAAIFSTAHAGLFSTVLSLALAIAVNFIAMIFSPAINLLLTRTHLLGPLIRLTGLIIAAVAMQMILNGLKASGVI